ncbi:MAG: cytochrome c oxidase assembly factor Coa1 family protein, partial [Solimonas sp.]
LMLVVIAVPSCGAMFMSVTGALKNNDAYRTSLSQIRANEEVKAALGEPIEAGYFVTGSINTNGPDGQAALQYSLKGSKAEGEAYVYASKHAGRWILLQVVVESGGHRTAVVGSPDAPLKPEQDT